MHRGNRAGLAHRGSTVAFGEYGLMALERCWMDSKQIESARVAISREMKRHGKLWIRIFPQNRSPRSRSKREWARERLRWKAGWPSFVQQTFCLKWTG